MQVKFDVNTKFDDAKKLLQNAYNIFLFDLKSMEEKASAASSGSSSKGAANSDNEQPGDGNKNADPTLPTEAKQTHRNCDINKIVINAEILNAPDVYVHIDVDESYELNVTRKLNILLSVRHGARCWLHIDSLARFSSSSLYLHQDVRDILKVHIKANSFFGARHGLSTLQQLIWYDDEDDALRILSAAHIQDEPKFR